MNRWSRIVLAMAVFPLCSISAFAFPQFLQMYNSDPLRNPAQDGCNTCHMSPQGGDARNAFGMAFETGGEKITPMLRAQFPDRFVYPVSRVGALVVHFTDPENKQVVVESGGMRNLVDVEKKTVDGTPATSSAGPAVTSAAPAASTTARPAPSTREVPVDEYAREGAFFGSNVVNLPDGKPQKAGGTDFLIGHRFGQDIKAAGFGGLFGFDSSAVVAYGARVGLTDRVSVSVMRSNLFKTISLSSALQLSRQNATTPLTLQVRGGVDGKQNFGLYRKSRNPSPRQYSPFIQVVGVRTFKDRVSFLLAPTFAFNTRDETRVFPGFAYGEGHNNTISLGIGAGIRFLRSASIVGEFIPRLAGYRGEGKDYGGLSVGLQKSTFRHTFELVVSRQSAMTPAQTAFQGVDTFQVGFNIYRKLR